MAGLKRITEQNKFRAKVGRAVAKLEIDEPLWCQDSPLFAEDDEFEDDGTLHVRRSGLRAVFGVSDGQEATGEEQNRQTRAIMEALGMKRKIGERVLVEEGDEDDQAEHECNCEYCTRRYE